MLRWQLVTLLLDLRSTRQERNHTWYCKHGQQSVASQHSSWRRISNSDCMKSAWSLPTLSTFTLISTDKYSSHSSSKETSLYNKKRNTIAGNHNWAKCRVVEISFNWCIYSTQPAPKAPRSLWKKEQKDNSVRARGTGSILWDCVSWKCQEHNTHEILPKWVPNNKDTNRYGNSEEKKNLIRLLLYTKN